MIEIKSCIIIRSEMNTWIDICIVPDNYVSFVDVEEVALKAYNEWFEIDPDVTIVEYIDNALTEANLCYDVYIKANEEEETL